MARVIFFLWPEPGHTLPALGLARSLARRGHEITVVSWDSSLGLTRTHGFEAVDVFQLSDLVEARAAWVAQGRWSEKLLEEAGHKVARAIAELVPSLVIVDALFWRITLRLAEQNVPCVHLSTSLPDEFDSQVYPWSSTRAPSRANSLTDALRRHLAWGGVRLSGWLKHRLKLPLESDTLDLSDVARRLQESHWPEDWCEPRAFHKPALGVPELVMCPRAFELPQKRARPYRYYVESGVDSNRPEDARGLAEVLADPRPLVLVSLGSQASRYTQSSRVFGVIAEVARRLPQLVFVVALVDSDVASIEFPSNVLVRGRVPQLQLLARAAVMLTHGGLGSVKECIVSGVPMCVVPLKWDQPSVAARVQYHGLGIALAPKQLDVESLRSAIERLLGNPQYKLRAELMRRAFSEVDRSEPGAELVDELLSPRHRPSPAPLALVDPAKVYYQ